MSREMIEKILHSKKIKYGVLDELMRDYLNFREHQYKNINIYIDLDTVTRQLYNDNMITSFTSVKKKDRMIISAEIINIIAHYRHYFASRKRMYTRFIMFYSADKSKYHLDIDPTYKEEFYFKRDIENPTFRVVNNMMRYTMQIASNIVKYIPNAYIINTGSIDPMVVPGFIMQNESIVSKGDYNMIMSNNQIFWQLLSEHENTFVLELRTDKSRLVTEENLIDTLLEKTKKVSSDFPNVDGSAMDIIGLFTKNSYMGSKGIKGYGPVKILNELNSLATKGKYNPLMTYSEDSLVEMFNEKHSPDLRKFYKLYDMESVINSNYTNINNVVGSQWIHIDDPVQVKKLNDEVFIDSPLLLDYLFEGEQ